ncbi:AAA family ATPase [Kumtagia ephedrae]|uniref:Uncharacterized protein n=1 Tax=Kumtagia ephedrae TaxID=2116701 RepID=A0A2P7S1K0_9HYPH|nr:AAA family ATPase [Mesorhizobium ephedrae]PSJ56347.1 hypothetical protein C7I84_20990 [Mesorhizobium ephedrae]
MYPSLSQVVTSVERLSGVHPFFGYAFLGFKLASLPIGTTQEFRYSFIRDSILEPYFRFKGVKGFYNPFKSSKQWVSERYDSTSLQRVIADTFSAAFVRDPDTHGWGWTQNYVQELSFLRESNRSEKIPLFDMAVWYCRNVNIQAASGKEPGEIIRTFVSYFNLLDEEIETLFDNTSIRDIGLSQQPVSENELLSYIGYPTEQVSDRAVSLRRLSVRNVGPFQDATYPASPRLNVIAGDNSLGKTLLLELVWWSLTGSWAAHRAEPQIMEQRSEIEFDLNRTLTRGSTALVPYNKVDGSWQRPNADLSSVALYFSFDGGVNIFIPRHYSSALSGNEVIRLGREQLLDGLKTTSSDGVSRRASNGLLQDVVFWQLLPERYPKRREVFEAALRALSPPEGRHLRLGPPGRIRTDTRELPTVRMPYGDVAFPYLSAGIQKAFTFAYVVAWVFFEFLDAGKLERDVDPQIVVLIDEVEAHLHPKWQRQIVPSLLAALRQVAPNYPIQLHIATHSPLVMASLEDGFDPTKDTIHVTKLVGREVCIATMPFTKHGSVNRWLESDIFGLDSARSKIAEDALKAANALLSKTDVAISTLDRIESDLRKALPDDDPFWVRWNRFASFHRPSGK